MSDVSLKSYSDTSYLIEATIKQIMDKIHSHILTVPGMGYWMGAMILDELRNFSRFDPPYKIPAYAGASPSTYQVRASGILLFPHGKTWFPLFILCPSQCRQKTCAVNLRNGQI